MQWKILLAICPRDDVNKDRVSRGLEYEYSDDEDDEDDEDDMILMMKMMIEIISDITG